MSLLQDVRFALRQLRRAPAFTLVAILTLGLAVAANTVVFSVVNVVLLRPLPYADPDRLVRMDTQFPDQGLNKFWFDAKEYLALAHDARSFESVGAWVDDSVNLTGSDQPLAVDVEDVTASLLPTLGVQPMMGRFFDASEDAPGDPRAVVISYGLWKRAFASDPNLVGKTVHTDGIPVSVVGVMPKGFEFPRAGIDMWTPLRINPATARAGNHYLTLIGRLKPGVGIDAARAEIASLGEGWFAADPGGHTINPKHPVVLERLYDDVVGPVRVALLALQAAVVFVLLIACANISNLLLARAEARSGEIAVRAALGATRGRMARQFLTESLVLGLLGSAAGIVLAVWGLDATVALLPAEVPRTGDIQLDGAVLAFAVGVSIVASLLFGLAPILHAHGNLGETLRSAGQRATGNVRKQIFRRALIVAEVGLAIVLVTGAGLMVRSLVRLQRVDLGFDPRGLLTMDVQLPQRTYPKAEDVLAFWKKLREGAAALPGARGATLAYGLPPVRQVNANDFMIVGATYVKGTPPWNVDYTQLVSDDYLETMGVHLIAGRGFEATDNETSPGVALINESMAKKFWPGENPIGLRVVLAPGTGGDEPDPVQMIVGIVADVKQGGIDAPTGTESYFSLRQAQQVKYIPRSLHLIVRSAGDPRALFGTARAFVGSLDPNLPVAYLRTMDRVVYDAIAKPRFVTTLLTAFAGIALLMAAIGIYGVMSYTVERRTQELGIRMALGADAGRLKRMLVRQGLALAGVGVALGLLAAGGVSVVLGQWLARLLFDVGSLDPATYAIVVLLTAGVAALACYVPARRATRIPPMVAMRHE